MSNGDFRANEWKRSVALNTLNGIARMPRAMLEMQNKSQAFTQIYMGKAYHYIDVIMTTMAFQITSLTVVYSVIQA